MTGTALRVSRWVLVLAGWTALALFLATQSFVASRYTFGTRPLTWGDAVELSLAEWYAWALVVPLVVWIAKRVPFERQRWWRAVLVHVPVALALSVVKMLADQAVLGALGWAQPGRFVTLRLHGNIITYAVIVALAHGALYYARSRERTRRAAVLESQLAKAELQVLKMQLHPHFLFNTLHAIAELMHEDVEAAEQMIVHLSELLRLSVDHASTEQVPLEEELQFLDRYLAIQRLRFGDRLQVEQTIDPAALGVRVPSLLLQPLVENAIRHGIAPRAEGGRLHINARRDGTSVWIEVQDDGPGPPAQGASSGGVGLANTRARLARLYGHCHQLELVRGPKGGAVARLSVPVAQIAD